MKSQPHILELPKRSGSESAATQTVRISRRASLSLVALAVILLGLFAYGGWKRRQRQVAALADANLPKRVAPATAAAADIVKDVPTGNVPTARTQPPVHPSYLANCRLPKTSRCTPALEPETGQRRLQPPMFVRSRRFKRRLPPVQQVQQPTPEEQRIQRRMRPSREPWPHRRVCAMGSAQVPCLRRRQITRTNYLGFQSVPSSRPEREISPDQQARRATFQEAFLKRARNSQAGDYLKSTRNAPISQYEIKAGWEIPAAMEQGLNSDLPGEVKALVTSNVYDTATGRYVLIPQGARLVGEYNSQLGYGQEGLQVIWNRIIYPDGSSLDLGGMLGQDAHGLSGFRDKSTATINGSSASRS